MHIWNKTHFCTIILYLYDWILFRICSKCLKVKLSCNFIYCFPFLVWVLGSHIAYIKLNFLKIIFLWLTNLSYIVTGWSAFSFSPTQIMFHPLSAHHMLITACSKNILICSPEALWFEWQCHKLQNEHHFLSPIWCGLLLCELRSMFPL